MKPGPLLFHITGIAIFVQLALGRLLALDFIPVDPHMALGFVVFALAVATTVFAWRFKPKFLPVRTTSAALVPLVALEAFLGFSMLDADNPLLSWVHFIVAMVIYGVAVAGMVTTIRWNQLAKKGTDVAAEPTK